MSIKTLKARHAELHEMISDLRAMMTKDQLKIRPNAKTAYQLICDLSAKMKDHMADQDQGIYPELLTHEDPKLKSMAWGFLNGQKPMRKQFDDYHQKWLKNCDFNFTDDFIADSFEIFDMVDERIEREQSVLLPTLESNGIYGYGESAAQ